MVEFNGWRKVFVLGGRVTALDQNEDLVCI